MMLSLTAAFFKGKVERLQMSAADYEIAILRVRNLSIAFVVISCLSIVRRVVLILPIQTKLCIIPWKLSKMQKYRESTASQVTFEKRSLLSIPLTCYAVSLH